MRTKNLVTNEGLSFSLIIQSFDVNKDFLGPTTRNFFYSSFVIFFTKLFDAFASFFQHVFRSGDNNAERSSKTETLARENEDALFVGEGLHEIQAGRYLREVIKLNQSHHVHCSFWHYWNEPRHAFKQIVSCQSLMLNKNKYKIHFTAF
jgi:hypothetical protein